MLMTEIKENLNRCKNILCSWIRWLNIINISALFKLIYRFNTVPIKIPVRLLAYMDKLILKFVWKSMALE